MDANTELELAARLALGALRPLYQRDPERALALALRIVMRRRALGLVGGGIARQPGPD